MVEGARLEIAYSVLSRIVGSNPTYSASYFSRAVVMELQIGAGEAARRHAVLSKLLEFIVADRPIKLPSFDKRTDRPTDRFALLSIGIEPNDFSGSVGDYRYQFEGEEDLLHLIVTKNNGQGLTVKEAQIVAAWLLEGVPPAMIWLRSGDYSHHFYVGHDELVGRIDVGTRSDD